jgi:hypothetical protein
VEESELSSEKIEQKSDKNLKNVSNDDNVLEESDIASDLLELELPGFELEELESEIEVLKEKKQKQKKAAIKKVKKIIDDDEDLGIIQPEFDF